MKNLAAASTVKGVATAVADPLNFAVLKRAVAEQFELMKPYPLYRVDLSDGKGSPEQRAAATGNKLWETYLASFPAGSNPIYRERTEHDCQCCRHFIRTVGAVVALINGEVVSLWDSFADMGAYGDVCVALSNLIHTSSIDNIFLHSEITVGTDKTFAQVISETGGFSRNGAPVVSEAGGFSCNGAPVVSEAGGFSCNGAPVVSEAERRRNNALVVSEAPASATVSTKTWEHFHLRLPATVVVAKASIGPKLSEARSTYDVALRGLREITMDAIHTVAELIAQNSLYRGEEHLRALNGFRRLKEEFDKLGLDQVSFDSENVDQRGRRQSHFAWSAGPSARIRNTIIGTLLVDLSEGVDIDKAVAAFESKVAPTNYKRPTALVTKAMIAKAAAKVEELGFTSALERRYATLSDITVNNILFVDRSVRTALGKKSGASVFESLTAAVPENKKALSKVEEVRIEDFIANILPKAETVEVLFENRHAGNLVSLVAPVDPGAKNMFKWPNRFSWSYNGDVADSIKERVKQAGGSVEGVLCCRLAWEYADDLDFWMTEPLKAGVSRDNRIVYSSYQQPESFTHRGNRIGYNTYRRTKSPCGGQLDVDANGCDGVKEHPVENIYYQSAAAMEEGTYVLSVNNYSRRSDGVGFEVEIEFGGETYNFVYDKAVRTGNTIHVADIEYRKKTGFKITKSLPSTQATKQLWGLTTQTFQKVSVAMLSPNYWVPEGGRPQGTRTLLPQTYASKEFEGVGNKHYFFMLENARNEGVARGFYNEFLSNELEPHRKTMEMVGVKMKTDGSAQQLSGLGFSSTQRNSLTVRVTGAFTRTVKVMI